MDALMTSSVDVSRINALIPEVVSFGRRTLKQQCVTSAYWIARNAQKATPATTINRIDSDLGVTSTPAILTSGKVARFSKNKRRQYENIAGIGNSRAIGIVLARMQPDSKFNQMTGGRWFINRDTFSAGQGGRGFWSKVWDTAIRMVKARHSSTHFLQAGWSFAIRWLFAHPDFVRMGARGGLSEQSKLNPLNTLDANRLGNAGMSESGGGDAVLVTAENAVGTAGYDVLSASHRAAMQKYAVPPLKEAIAFEERQIWSKIQDYLDRGLQRLAAAKQ